MIITNPANDPMHVANVQLSVAGEDGIFYCEQLKRQDQSEVVYEPDMKVSDIDEPDSRPFPTKLLPMPLYVDVRDEGLVKAEIQDLIKGGHNSAAEYEITFCLTLEVDDEQENCE